MKASTSTAEAAKGPRSGDSRESLAEEAEAGAAQMLEALAMYSDELMELLLSRGEVPEELITSVARKAVPAAGSPRLSRLGLSQQGRPAAAGRGGAVPALAAGTRGSMPHRVDDPASRSLEPDPAASRSSAWRSRSSKTRSAN
jgi:hypothetical protein